MTGKGVVKKKLSEDCCFVCKDGGDLLICDHKDCVKCFHPFCVGKEDSILESEEKWVCDRHTCFNCRRSSAYLYCYTCTSSVCRNCLPAEKVDFTDAQTVEFYFVGYYRSIKDKEGFDLKDLYAAAQRANTIRNEHQSESGPEADEEEDDEDEEYKIYDYDRTEYETSYKSPHRGSISKSDGMKPALRSNKKKKTHHGNAATEPPHPVQHHTLTADPPKGTENGGGASNRNVTELLSDDDENVSRVKFDDVESNRWCIRGPYGDRRDECSLTVLRKWSEQCSYALKFKAWRDDENEENAISLPEAISIAFPKKFKGEEKTHHGNAPTEPRQRVEHNVLTADPPKGTENVGGASNNNVIELLSDDDENVSRVKFDDVESSRWCIRGSHGDRRDECSLTVLRKWSEKCSYALKFKVWRDDENEENAISLPEAISIAFPKKFKGEI